MSREVARSVARDRAIVIVTNSTLAIVRAATLRNSRLDPERVRTSSGN